MRPVYPPEFPKYVEHSAALAEGFVECDEPDVSLPYVWRAVGAGDGSGGPPVTDPLMLYISVPAMGDWDDPNAPIWSLPFSALIDEMIEGLVVSDGTLPPESLPTVIEVRDALVALTDKLSATIIERTQHDPQPA